MSWFWMNVPLAVVFFAAIGGIPLYMVLRHRSWGAAPADSVEPAFVAQPAEARALVAAQAVAAL